MRNQPLQRDERSPASEATAPVVQVDRVSKRYGDTLALDKVSLDVERGELVVLIGLSGSGKSTLLRHLNGLTTPSSGAVSVFGQSIEGASHKEIRELRRRVGFIFQQFGLVGRLSALENVLVGRLGSLRLPRYGTLTYPKPLRREAIDHLDRVGLADQAFQRADTLSGGQQQRVAIARALFQGADMILADEPVASLDPESSGQVMNLLFEISREEGLTVVCSLHQVDLALGWADRMVGLRDGRIVLDDSAKQLTQEQVMLVYTR